MEGMIKIWTSTQSYQVEIAKQKLEENGIESFIINKQDSAYVVIGEAELYVNEKDVDAAQGILDIHHSENN